jgi:ribonuclease HI
MNWESELTKRAISVEYWWVPAHKGVEGNEEADQQAKKAVYKHCGS